MAPVKIPGLNVPLIVGPQMLGFLLSYMLFGMFVIQYYLYHVYFPGDPKWMRRFVFLVFLVEFSFIVFSTIAAWERFGPGWGDVSTITTLHWSYEPMSVFNGIAATLVQSFYVWRIYKLGRSAVLPTVIMLLSLGQLGCILAYTSITTMNGLTIDALFDTTPIVTSWVSCAVTCDVLITVTIVTLLYRSKKGINMPHTTHLITRLIRFSVETGFITTLVAIFELVAWLKAHDLSLHFMGFSTLGMLYANTLLATLNSRVLIFAGSEAVHDHEIDSGIAPSFSAAGAGVHGRQRASLELTQSNLSLRGPVPVPAVHISRTQKVEYDDDSVYMGSPYNPKSGPLVL